MENGVMMQYFEWYLNSEPHLWNILKKDAEHLNNIGITAIWMPPAFKGASGKYDVGYGVYDVYDLGEFNAKGSICTKYGSKAEYLQAIQALHDQGIKVYGDIVLNHKMGADGNEIIYAHEVNQNNKNEIISGEEKIEVSTIFTFPARNDKYSDFHWDWRCFDGIDYDILSKRHSIFLFEDKQWNQQVDDETGNYDYLMGADIDFSVQEVIDEMNRWGKWYLNLTHLDGLRLDALKHIPAYFYKDWLSLMRKDNDLFVVGEYWHGDIRHLLNYLSEVNGEMSLFDVPLHYRFYDASHSNGTFDMRKIFDGTLVKADSTHAVTFVDNHDTQPSQGLQSWIEDWFKPLAYAIILLRLDGYPCIFYGDYYGIPHNHISSKQPMLDQLLYLRKHYAIKSQDDYFDHPDIVGWIRNKEENPLVVIMSNNQGGSKKMYVGTKYSSQIFEDIYQHKTDVIIDNDGYGEFSCDSGSMSIYLIKGNEKMI